MNPGRANLLTALGLLALLWAVAATAPQWALLLRRPLPGPTDNGSAAVQERPRDDEGAARARKQINVKLFFQAGEGRGLVIEERPVAFSPDLSQQIRAVVEELIRGSRSGLAPTMAPTTRVLDVFVSKGGVAYVDLSKEVTQDQPGGSEAELITVYSVVNSLTTNFPAVKRVQILVEDHPAPTLAGHVDLTRPLPPDMTFLASAVLTPETTP